MLAIISNIFIVLHPDVLSFDPSLNENLNIDILHALFKKQKQTNASCLYFEERNMV